MIVGIERRKENRTASFALHPNTLAQQIVEALLEMPGISAADCRAPIHKEAWTWCLKVAGGSLRILHFCPENKMREVAIRQNPKQWGWEARSRRGFSKK